MTQIKLIRYQWYKPKIHSLKCHCIFTVTQNHYNYFHLSVIIKFKVMVKNTGETCNVSSQILLNSPIKFCIGSVH